MSRGTSNRGTGNLLNLNSRCYSREITVTEQYEAFEQQVEQWISTCVTSRTVNSRTGESFHREIPLVKGSQSLRQIWLEAKKLPVRMNLKPWKVRVYAHYEPMQLGKNDWGVKAVTFSTNSQPPPPPVSIVVEEKEVVISGLDRFIESRWPQLDYDVKQGDMILERLLKKPHDLVKEVAKLIENPFGEPPELLEGTRDIVKDVVKLKPTKLDKPDKFDRGFAKILLKPLAATTLQAFINTGAKEVVQTREKLYRSFARGVISVLLPDYRVKAPVDKLELDFFNLGIVSAQSLSDLQKYQLAVALVDRYRRFSGNLGSTYQPYPQEIDRFIKKWGYDTFLEGFKNEYSKPKYSVD